MCLRGHPSIPLASGDTLIEEFYHFVKVGPVLVAEYHKLFRSVVFFHPRFDTLKQLVFVADWTRIALPKAALVMRAVNLKICGLDPYLAREVDYLLALVQRHVRINT